MRRIGFVLVATFACVTAPTAIAQEWVVNSGFTTGASYTDNYFFTTTGKQSGTTLTIAPFVSAARNTESSSVSAFLGVGANKVFGVTPKTEYLSGRLGLNGSTDRGALDLRRVFQCRADLDPAESAIVERCRTRQNIPGHLVHGRDVLVRAQ